MFVWGGGSLCLSRTRSTACIPASNASPRRQGSQLVCPHDSGHSRSRQSLRKIAQVAPDVIATIVSVDDSQLRKEGGKEGA